jgi:hypothetical protein
MYRGRGLCDPCYHRAQYHGTLIDFERRTVARDELLDDWALLRSEGYTAVQAAPRLGMTPAALLKALDRARRDGDPRARFSYHGMTRALRKGAAP